MFSKEYVLRRGSLLLHFCKSLLIVGVVDDSWIFRSTSEFSSLQYVVLVAVYEENLASRGYVGRKARNILITFSGYAS